MAGLSLWAMLAGVADPIPAHRVVLDMQDPLT
jgi:hypothetical protein